MSIKQFFAIVILILTTIILKSQDSREKDIYEEFALSDNRVAVLQKLIPGTEAYYFLNTLYLQQNNKIKEAEEVLLKWQERIPSDEKFTVMKNRQILLNMTSKPSNSFAYLKEKLNLNFDYEKPITITPQIYPNKLTAAHIDIDLKIKNLLMEDLQLKEFTPKGLFKLSKEKLTNQQLEILLNTYEYPDLPNLVNLILKDFKNNEKRNFGDLNTHNVLTLNQLKELKDIAPILLTHKKFIEQYLLKSKPIESNNFSASTIIHKKYLQDSWEFVKNLSPSFNTLKARILYDHLNLCLNLNQPDFVLFKEYLKIPRTQNYANVDYYHKNNQSNQYILYADPEKDYPQFSFISSDSELVTTYLYSFIQTKTDTKDIQQFFDFNFFNKFEAETKIKAGIGKSEDFYQILTTEDLENLKNSVEISFTKQNKHYHLSNDNITLYIQLKNIPELEIQIYKLNTLDYYRLNLAEIEPDVSIEGYVPNYIRKIKYPHSSTIRHLEQIELKEIDNHGIYIIELLGNGIKNRTYIRKGNLYPAVYNTNEGQEVQLFDDYQNKITNYSIYFGNHQLKSNSTGIVMIPYTAEKEDSPKKIVFSHQDLACLYEFDHSNESYSFSILILNTPESILPGQNCNFLIKPTLSLNSKPIGVSKIKNITSTVQFFNRKDETLTLQTYRSESLKDIMELKAFVPENASHFTIKSEGSIEKKADEETINLSKSCQIDIIGSKSQSSIFGLYLKKQKENFQIECLNKAGLPQADICVYLNFYHQYFQSAFTATLQTDKNGIIELNNLPNIFLLSAKIYNGSDTYWQLSNQYTNRPNDLTALENETLGIPFYKKNKELSEDAMLIKKSGSNFIEDFTNQLRIENDILRIPTDTAGNFTLYLKEESLSINIKILKGKRINTYYVTENSISDASAYMPHQIVIDKIDETSSSIKGKIINTHPTIKCYLWTGRYFSNLPKFINKHSSYQFYWPSETRQFNKTPNSFLESINLSKEQIYILERRNIKKFPGNNLISPSAILNPWNTSNTIGISGGGGGGGSYGVRSGGGRRRAVMKGGGSKATEMSDNTYYGFLPNAIIKEIMVQEDGSFEVDFKGFDDQKFIQLGVISPYGYTIKELPLSSKANNILNISQQKDRGGISNKLPLTTITTIDSNKTLSFLKSDNGAFLLIDTLSKLNATLEKTIANKTFNDFEFLGHWSKLSEIQKLLKYQKFACHELHFYIYQKDRPFFNRHIKDFLINKQIKTIVDKWLLDEDLSQFLSFNQFNKLNLFEKILLIKKYPELKEPINRQIQDFLEINKPKKDKELELMEQILNAEKINPELFYSKLKVNENEPETLDKNSDETESSEAGKDMPPVLNSKPVLKKSVNTVRTLDVNAEGLGIGEIEIEETPDNETTALYRDLKSTKEKAEAYYYKTERKNESIDLIKPSQFWLDYINNSNAIFLSHNILDFSNIHEAILALSLIDLPENSTEPTVLNNERETSITAKSPTIALYNSFKSGVFEPDQITLHQHYFHFNNTEKIPVLANKNSFLINKKYNCATVVTNTTSQQKDLYLNYLIPEGSLPLDDSLRNKTKFISLQPYASFVVENQFFFPTSNTYSHLPSIVQNIDRIFTNEKSYPLTVTSDPEALDKTSWEYIVKEGNKEKILAYIKTNHFNKANFADIYYLMKDSDFFEKITSELRSRFYFDYNIWSFCIYHADIKKLAEFLPNTFFNNSCGQFFSSPVLKFDAIDQKTYEHREFWPLIKGRAHATNPINDFENAALDSQYKQFIQYLIYKPNLNDSDLLNLTIYTINQSKIDLAIELFSKIKDKNLTEKLQYDYLKAYLAFYQTDIATAESTLLKHKDLSIINWKEKFTELQIQLNEIKTGIIDKNSRSEKYSSVVLAEKEAFLNAKLIHDAIEISSQNIKNVKIEYYHMDLEILFSNAPFEVMNKQFKFITIPNFSDSISFDGSSEIKIVKIPDSLIHKNLIMKISGDGKSSVVNYYPSKLNILISENYGELHVLSKDTKKAMPTIYIKVYGKKDSTSEFVKDGYTDLRGVFNYSLVSDKKINQYSQLAILVMSDTYGASIHYVAPPQ